MGMLFGGIIWLTFTLLSCEYWVGWDSCLAFLSYCVTAFFLLPGLKWLWCVLTHNY